VTKTFPMMLAAALTCVGSLPALAEPADPIGETAPSAPRLIVAISVDQFSADLFSQYRRYFDGGLARMQQGAVFPSAFQSHAATETCPGHSTLLTGVHPSRSGIIANMWFDPAINRADKRIYCVEDESDPASTSVNPVVSSRHLRVPTLGDRLKQRDSASRNVAVSGKDRAAVMMGGHAVDQIYWWTKQGAFGSLAGRSLMPAAEEVNAKVAAQIAQGAPPMAVPAWCITHDREVAVGGGNVGRGRFAAQPNSEIAFRVSPRSDAATLDLAKRLVDTMQLGQGSATDVLSISLSATDYIGHTFGTEGLEMCLQLAELDKSLGTFFAGLDRLGIDYVVALTADHGSIDLPERLVEQGLPDAAHADPSLWPGRLEKAVAEATGILAQGSLLYGDGPFGDFYVSRQLGPADRSKVSAALVGLLEGHPQVAAVFTRDELAAAPQPTGSAQDWTLLDRARASFDAERSGDVVILLRRAVVPVASSGRAAVTTHGSAWDYDRRVPLLFWRRGITGFEQPAPVQTVDIAPTLGALIGLQVPAGEYDGRCLDIDGSAADSCAGW